MEEHIFDNGIKVYKHHLSQGQLDRYKVCNVHEEEEEELFIDIVKSIRNDGCFVSIGAAIGYYVLLALKINSELQIEAYEPLAQHRQYLNDNIKLNSLNNSNINLYSEGISQHGGDLVFKPQSYRSKIFEYKDFFSLSQLKKTLKNIVKLNFREIVKYEKLKTITLNEVIDVSNRDFVDLVQIDIQGLEYGVLLGGKKCLLDKKIKNLLIGTHGSNIHHDCIEFLKGVNYKIELEEYNTSQPDGIIYARSK